MSKKIERFKNFILSVLFIILIFSPLLFIISYIYFFAGPIPQEIYQGNSSEGFCSEKCGNFHLMKSNNNTGFIFIRCECVESTQIDASPYWVRSNLKTFVKYFDSRNLNEITEKEVLSRIENKN